MVVPPIHLNWVGNSPKWKSKMNINVLIGVFYILIFIQFKAFSSCNEDVLIPKVNKRKLKSSSYKSIKEHINKIIKNINTENEITLSKDCFYRKSKKVLKQCNSIIKGLYNIEDIKYVLLLINLKLEIAKKYLVIHTNDRDEYRFKQIVVSEILVSIEKDFYNLDEKLYLHQKEYFIKFYKELMTYEINKLQILNKITDKYWKNIDCRSFDECYDCCFGVEIYLNALDRQIVFLCKSKKNYLKLGPDENDELLLNLNKRIIYITNNENYCK